MEMEMNGDRYEREMEMVMHPSLGERCAEAQEGRGREGHLCELSRALGNKEAK